MPTTRKRSSATGAQFMVQTAAFAARLMGQVALWEKVRASARRVGAGKWEIRIGDPHGDEQLSAQFEYELGAGAPRAMLNKVVEARG